MFIAEISVTLETDKKMFSSQPDNKLKSNQNHNSQIYLSWLYKPLSQDRSYGTRKNSPRKKLYQAQNHIW